MKILLAMAFWLTVSMGAVTAVFGMQSSLNAHAPKPPDATTKLTSWRQAQPNARPLNVDKPVPQPLYPIAPDSFLIQAPTCK